MTKVNQSDGLLRTRVQTHPFLEGSPAKRSREGEGFQQKVAQEVAKMRCHELAVDAPPDCDDVDCHDHRIRGFDESYPLTVEPPLTLSKICSNLTAVEQLWLVRMVKAHGKEVVLARWQAYEAHINYVRYLR